MRPRSFVFSTITGMMFLFAGTQAVANPEPTGQEPAARVSERNSVQRLVINKATWGPANGPYKDVTVTVQRKVVNSTLKLDVSGKLFGRAPKDQHKYLVVDYTLNGEKGTRKIIEGEQMMIGFGKEVPGTPTTGTDATGRPTNYRPTDDAKPTSPVSTDATTLPPNKNDKGAPTTPVNTEAATLPPNKNDKGATTTPVNPGDANLPTHTNASPNDKGGKGGNTTRPPVFDLRGLPGEYAMPRATNVEQKVTIKSDGDHFLLIDAGGIKISLKQDRGRDALISTAPPTSKESPEVLVLRATDGTITGVNFRGKVYSRLQKKEWPK